MFRLCDAAMYTDMSKDISSMTVDRGIALHKMIRLISMAAGGEGYLNFMGNEFGHPEWIDFPREGNGWSHYYCRRQWSLMDNGYLKYHWLSDFDKAMVATAQDAKLYKNKPNYMFGAEDKQVLAFERNGKVFVFNFSPFNTYDGYIRVPAKGDWKPVLSTDEGRFGGWDRVQMDYIYKTEKQENGDFGFSIYLPARCAIVLERQKAVRAPKAVKTEEKAEKTAKKATKAKAEKTETAEKPKRTRKTKKAE